MKNIHLLPTDKPSKIGQSVFDKSLHFNPIFNYELEKERVIPQNIYFTSNEEAKEGDWGYMPFFGGDVKLVGKYFADDWKKIILTTDQDLINDGVQAIPDEFLEWFVKNPSCEKVEVKKGKIKLNDDGEEYGFPDMSLYKIIIPKEEPKQETLEEFIDKVDTPTDFDQFTFDEGIRVGAKWQAERMYSLDEIKDAMKNAYGIKYFSEHKFLKNLNNLKNKTI